MKTCHLEKRVSQINYILFKVLLFSNCILIPGKKYGRLRSDWD